jgi:signal transduction histidine kinase
VATGSKSGNLFEFALLVSLGILWGIPYALTKISLTTIPPMTLVAGRVSIAAATLWIIVVLSGCKIPDRKQFQISREAPDIVGSQTDRSLDPAFIEAMKNKVYFGPVDFVRESEPYMTIALAGAHREYGVIVARVNLKFIWDVVSRIRVGNRGRAYVIDAQGRLIADPDISMVLRNIDLSHLAHVQAARASVSEEAEEYPRALDIKGQRVLSAHAMVAPVDWLLFVELPIDEAYAPLYASIKRSGFLLLASLALAVLAGLLLAHRMVVPIRTLHRSAARIASGDLTQRILINTDDELEVLGEQFNEMATRLQDSYATLERKVEERTRQLEIANQAKSRFLAAASHDLRQPLHALGLFVAQLQGRTKAAERRQLVSRIDAALAAMNELFSALLDISKLDAGVLTQNITEFPAAQLLKRVETTFAGAAREKGPVIAGGRQHDLGAERFHPSRADRVQSGIQRSALYE